MQLKSHLAHALVLPAVLLAMGPSLSASAADWPAYRKDAHRSAVTEQELRLPMRRAWVYRCAQRPRPAWPHRIKVLNSTDFDYAPQPVAAGGIVCFGSSADDTVRALDAKTGRLKWRFTTGGPVRFAPQIAQGKVYFASDDGFAYCLDADTGKLVWSFRAAPGDEQFIGNDRAISRWPVRTGLLVADGVAYCAAGLWPSEGVYVYALDAETGKLIWCNDTSGFSGKGFHDSPTGGHQGEFIIRGVSPQGALLAGENVLLVPQGHSAPAGFDRKTGALRYGAPAGGFPGKGGTWVTIDGGNFYIVAMHRSRKIFLNGYPVETGRMARLLRHSDRQLPQLSLSPDGRKMLMRTLRRGRLSVIVRGGKIIARNAYDLAMAGKTLLVGLEDAVEAVDAATNRRLWRGQVRGQARGLAVADGRLIVATDTGEITCFMPGRDDGEAGPAIHDPSATLRRPTPKIAPADAEMLERLAEAGMDRGYALVLGDADGRLSLILAAKTRLHVVNALTDGEAAVALRERLLSSTALYGSRIHVQAVKGYDRLPFSQYFANAVIVAAPAIERAGKDLYRVLRPCGGILLAAGADAPKAESLLRKVAAPDGEIARSHGRPFVRRGPLDGANDWNTGGSADKRVRWPLRPIWFGGPTPAELSDYRSGETFARAPTTANGRYFAQGEKSMTAVDAYNGRVLWTRPLPNYWNDLRDVDGELHTVANAGPPEYKPDKKHRTVFARGIGADARHVFLSLGEGYFRGRGRGFIQLDARTGRQKTIYAPFIPPAAVVSLKTPKSWPLDIDADHSGTLGMRGGPDGLTIRLTTRDPAVTALDAWELFFDFRRRDARYGLYGRGTFGVRVTPARGEATRASWTAEAGVEHPAITVSGKPRADGSETIVRLPWAQLEKLTGRRPATFDFAATLNSHDGDPNAPILQRHLFGDAAAGGINNGWARIIIDPAAARSTQPADDTPAPAIIAGPSPPKGWLRWGAARVRTIDEQVRLAPRTHPLTGEVEPRIYRSGTWACGGPSFSATTVFRRPSKPAVGIYDFADDSGLRFFPAVSAPCGSSSIAALGLFIFSEARFRCDCTPPIRTSFALAPAEKRLNEDWAIYFDLPVRTAVRRAAVNLGAFGDRRDDDGVLWLALPRTSDRGMGYPLAPGTKRAMAPQGVWMRHMPASINVPMELTVADGLGPYRFNSDRVAIEGTDRPWIYASGIRGIRKARMKLNFLKPLASRPARRTPTIDGKADFKDKPQATLPFTATAVHIRHDAEGLYFSARRPPVVDRRGKIAPWARTTTGTDARVWDDDSWELFLSDTTRRKVMHLGVSASGARYDALCAGKEAEDSKWNGAWAGAASADEAGLTVEIAVPWRTLADAGLDKDALTVNFQMNQKDISGEANKYLGGEGRNWRQQNTSGEALVPLGAAGRQRCGNFAPLGLGSPPKPRPRSFTVRLHFAEPDAVAAGERVFDVKLQGAVVLKSFDIFKAAGAARKAVVKEFRHIRADDELTLEFVPLGESSTSRTAPVVSAVELFDEAPRKE